MALNPLITGPPTSPSINTMFASSTTAITNNDIWISQFAAPDNHPVYSGLICTPWPNSYAPNSILSHMDDQMWLYSSRSRISPGDVQDYVMGPFGIKGILRRTLTDVETNTFLGLGYSLNPSYTGVAKLINLPPYSTKMAGYNNIFDNAFPEMIAADFPALVNNVGSNLIIDIGADLTSIDLENNPITIAPGSLVNIRGSGTGGNNHNLLSVAADNRTITYTPRSNFYGRAQFGLKLFDGTEVGSYVIYTIDVLRGTNVNCAPGQNLILNGDLEEGTEVKQVGPEEIIDASSREQNDLREGKIRQGIQFADCQPYCYLSNNWGPYGAGEMVKDSWINCNGTIYKSAAGSGNTSFPTFGSDPAPNSSGGIGERYKVLYGSFNYFNLCSDMENCHRYTLEFDYYSRPYDIATGTNIPLTVGFTNVPSFPALATLTYSFIHNLTVTSGSWQHVIIPFTYCGTVPASILYLRQHTTGQGLLTDNLQLTEDLSPAPPLIVSITPNSSTICTGDNITLNSGTSNVLCTPTYNWTPGSVTTASIIVSPTATTTYVLTVDDGCRNSSASATITVTPLPVATFSYMGTPYCQDATSNPSPTFSGGGNAGTFTTTTGLSINASTGTVDLAASTAGTYTVTNTIAASGGCTAVTATATITINNCSPPPCGVCPLTLAVGGVLSGNPTPYSVYCLNNNITISGTVNINLSEIKIAPNVTITVPNGAVLNINGSHLYSCATMWQGIIVQPGGRIKVTNFGAVVLGVGLVKRYPLIEDARTAIDIQTGSPITAGFILNVLNATFNRNEYSIKINGYNQSITAYPFNIVNSVFTCRDIPFTGSSLNWPQTTTVKAVYTPPTVLHTPYINTGIFSETNAAAYLKPPFTTTLPGSKSNMAIVLNRVGAVAFSGSTPSNWYEIKIGVANGGSNVFDNHGTDIDAFNFNLTCVNNVFQNAKGQKGGIAINGQASDINCRIQVMAGNPSGAFNNKFYDCSRAINTTNYFENTFTKCEVRSTQAGPVTAPPNPLPLLNHRGEYGFFVTTNRFRVINMSDNKLYNIENAITFNANFGPFNIGGIVTSSNGQYSGQVNVDRNEIASHLPANPITTQYVRSAIVLTNVIASGIQAIPGNTVTANNNNISNVHKGIRVSSWERKNIINNTNVITLVTDPYSATATQYGIVHNKNTGATLYGTSINSNSVTGTAIFTNPQIYGIATSLCQNERVVCNSVNGTTHGIEYAGGHLNVKFDNNFMANNNYGYVLSSNAIIGLQGDPSHPADNKWSGAWTVPNFKTATLTGSSSQNSKMYVRTSGTSQFNPNGSGTTTLSPITDLYNFTNGSLILSTTPVPYVGCAVVVGGGGGGGMPGSAIALLEDIAQDNISHVKNPDETKYINKNQLYRLLKADPSLRTSSVVLQDFYTASIPTVRETFTNIEDDIASGDLLNGQSKTNALAPVNSIEDNYKTFFNAYLKYQTDTILESDSIAIVNLANACPFTDGDVVYQARALYNSIYRTNIYFENNCPDVTERSFSPVKNTELFSFDVLVYPNPNAGNFSLVPFNADITELNIKVIDVNGKMVFMKKITSGDRMFNLNIDSTNGIYMMIITDPNTSESITKRIVIQK